MSSPRYALISVSNRDNLDKIAIHLVAVGFTLLTTTGSKKFLDDIGVASVAVEEFTSQREILGGRVKTLHPKIHGGILAKRSNPDHQADLLQEGIPPIDVVIVNLYPFLDHVRSESAKDPEKMVEFIDIGGPTMIRAAAKNFRSVLALIDPADYDSVIPSITLEAGVLGVPLNLRKQLSVKVFASLARYNLEIARYLSTVSFEGDEGKANSILFPEIDGIVLERKQELRYGENPQQSAAFYMPLGEKKGNWKQLQGKELSYNNLLDFDSIVRMLKSVSTDQALAIIVKHLNPCGIALAETPVVALERAKLCDPRSHFGGIIGFNRSVDLETAKNVAEDFAEIIVAPEFSHEALAVLAAKKNLRVLQVNLDSDSGVEFRSVESGMLLQTPDKAVSLFDEAEQVSGEPASTLMRIDLELAWAACAHVKSNAVVIVKNGMLVGTGAGQMSRIDSTELALSKASFHKHDLVGAVAASDAFFPFPDSLELLAERGIKAVIAPKGSRADAEVIATAKRLGVALFFTQDRHFRH